MYGEQRMQTLPTSEYDIASEHEAEELHHVDDSPSTDDGEIKERDNSMIHIIVLVRKVTMKCIL